MGITKWANNVIERFPTDTNQPKDEWYGVENAVDVLSIALAVKDLEAENKRLKGLLREIEKSPPYRHVPNWVVIKIEQALKG